MKIQFKIFSIFILFTTVTFISCNMESHVYALRDTGPAGGLIFYVDEADEFSWDYLEAAPSDQSSGVLWSNGSNILTGATGWSTPIFIDS